MERRISSLELSPTRDILRSQNNFVYITDSRLRALLHSSRILQPLVIEPGAPVWRIIASMVVSYPTQSSRYLTWGGGSECGRIDVLNRDGWIARRDCMRALVALSVCSQRYAVLSEDLAQYFDMDTLGRWFPVIQSSRLEFLVPNAALHDRSGDASSSLSLHATSHDVIVQQLLSNKVGGES